MYSAASAKVPRAPSTRSETPEPGILALKHVVRKDEKDIRFVEQMEAEFEVAKAFHHPHLRRCFEFKTNKTMIFKVTEAFLTMELVEGSLWTCRCRAT